MQNVQVKVAQIQLAPLISDAISVERDSASRVRAVALLAQVAHRNICFL
jgi:hypothetical protein